MSTEQTTATIVDGTQRLDVSVPVGTTVSGVLAQLERPLWNIELVDELGRTVPATESFGTQIPPGTVLHLRDAAASPEHRSDGGGVDRSGPFAMSGWAAAVAVAVLAGLTTVLSTVLSDHRSTPAMLALFLVQALVSVQLVRRDRVTESIWWSMVAPLPVAIGVTGLIGLPQLATGWAFALAVCWSAAVAAFGVRAWKRHEYTDAATRVWLLPAVGLSAIALTRMPDGVAGPVLIAVGVMGLAFAPMLSLKVPENQLLHLNTVMLTTDSVHTPDAPEPSRVTMPRARRTVRLGNGLRITAVLLACAAMLAGSALTAGRIRLDSVEGWASLVAFVLGLVVFVLNPRTARDQFTRWAPRLTAMTVLLAGSLLSSETAAAWWWLAVVGIGVAAIGTGVALARNVYAPAMTRLGDIIGQISLALAVPAAAVAAGAFTLTRTMG